MGSWIVRDWASTCSDKNTSAEVHIVKADGSITTIDACAVLIAKGSEGFIVEPGTRKDSPIEIPLVVSACRESEEKQDQIAGIVVYPLAGNSLVISTLNATTAYWTPEEPQDQ